jgi:hypothetical protein
LISTVGMYDRKELSRLVAEGSPGRWLKNERLHIGSFLPDGFDGEVEGH